MTMNRQRRLRAQQRRQGSGLTTNLRSVRSQRLALVGRHGSQFGGDRDLYAVLGYPKNEPDWLDYLARHTRQDIAGTIVDFPAEETWRDWPDVRDGKERDAEDDTPFETEWRRLAKRLGLWQAFERADKLAGIGRYSILLIGVAGQSELSTPVERVAGLDALLYVRPYSEDAASIEELEDDPASPRFGLPKFYKVTFGAEGKEQQRLVHASRVIHIAENALENDIYGRPRLQRVYNRLMDLEKVVGGSAEATWKLIRKGFVLDIDPNVSIPDGFSDDLEEQLDEYDHGLRRFLKTQGLTPHDLGSQVVDPTGIVGVLVGLIAATTRIPQRILLGSERGELASSQDAQQWAGYIGRRRSLFAESVMIDAVLKRFLGWGALPMPDAGEWSVHWQALFEMSEPEKAATADTWSQAFERIARQAGQSAVSVEEFREWFTPLPVEMEAITSTAGAVGDIGKALLALKATGLLQDATLLGILASLYPGIDAKGEATALAARVDDMPSRIGAEATDDED